MTDNEMFELMSKMYTEMQEGFKKNDKRFDSMEKGNAARFDSIENDIKKLGAKIDGKLIPFSEALLDGYKDNVEHITIIDDKVDRLQISEIAQFLKRTFERCRVSTYYGVSIIPALPKSAIFYYI